jgi:hypothetical protein
MLFLKKEIARAGKRVLREIGYKIVRAGVSGEAGYLSATATLEAARANGQSICEYVETIWNKRGCTARVIQEMKNAGCFTSTGRVVEIGPGTGRYLDLVLKEMSPSQYDIYEIAHDWASWITETYGRVVVRQRADGCTLSGTPTDSCTLIHAHGVFVCLNLLNAFEYFTEIVRVCAPGGHIVFDFYPAAAFDENRILHLLKYEDRYLAVIDSDLVQGFFQRRGFELVHEFVSPHGNTHSQYFIFRNSSKNRFFN